MHIMPCVASKRLVHQTIWIVFEYTLVEGVEVDLQYDICSGVPGLICDIYVK